MLSEILVFIFGMLSAAEHMVRPATDVVLTLSRDGSNERAIDSFHSVGITGARVDMKCGRT